ncbi:MAG: LLM class flavin-dependent oxidoreductase, partial [Acidimicrobiia bacterium]|nr:LLM class flavin-dependent oxidoreductase [Acidimicrobiia bacterium]
EAAGYRRFWVAEHHLNPGVVGSSPPLVISLVAAATERIRVGSGAVQLGHQTPLSVVEQFGIIAALHPGRIDLGLGRSGSRRSAARARDAEAPAGARLDATALNGTPAHGAPPAGRTTPRGLFIPPRFSVGALLASPRFAVQASLLQQPGARTPAYEEQVGDILALLGGTYCSAEGVEAHAAPGEGAPLDVWVLGSSAGESARVAGERGLPFAANYHVSPATVLEAAEAYRAAFRPSVALPRPYVIVSADAVVGPDDAAARRLAAGYGLWVHSIRSGQGAIPFPTPEQAAAHEWTEEERSLVADRVDTQFVGSAATVADGLEVLAAEVGADEVMVTTITHDHADRARSYDLLAAEWRARR